MTASAIAGLIASILGVLGFILRVLFKRQIEREVRLRVELEQERSKLDDYKATREKLDAVEDPGNDVDALREWLRRRGSQ